MADCTGSVSMIWDHNMVAVFFAMKQGFVAVQLYSSSAAFGAYFFAVFFHFCTADPHTSRHASSYNYYNVIPMPQSM